MPQIEAKVRLEATVCLNMSVEWQSCSLGFGGPLEISMSNLLMMSQVDHRVEAG
jgi:hypothetical protein